MLGPDYPHEGNGDGKARAAADEILTKRGQQPRLLRNTLLFLAPDRRRLAELEQAMRMPWPGGGSWRSRRAQSRYVPASPSREQGEGVGSDSRGAHL